MKSLLMMFLLIISLIFSFSNLSFAYSHEEIAIMRNIKCPICNGQSIYDSNNAISKQMRDKVASLYAEHKSSPEIESYFRNYFGDDIIMNHSGRYLYLLYIIPLSLLVLALLRVL